MQNITSLVDFIFSNNMAFCAVVVWVSAISIACAAALLMIVQMVLRKNRLVIVPHVYDNDYILSHYINGLQLLTLVVFCVGWIFAMKI